MVQEHNETFNTMFVHNSNPKPLLKPLDLNKSVQHPTQFFTDPLNPLTADNKERTIIDTYDT